MGGESEEVGQAYWVSGSEPPSRTFGARAIYIYIYLYVRVSDRVMLYRNFLSFLIFYAMRTHAIS